ncbi:hypothetical protein AB990_20220, partial [Alkalihalobacillus pseudalcaliphilus]
CIKRMLGAKECWFEEAAPTKRSTRKAIEGKRPKIVRETNRFSSCDFVRGIGEIATCHTSPKKRIRGDSRTLPGDQIHA